MVFSLANFFIDHRRMLPRASYALKSLSFDFQISIECLRFPYSSIDILMIFFISSNIKMALEQYSEGSLLKPLPFPIISMLGVQNPQHCNIMWSYLSHPSWSGGFHQHSWSWGGKKRPSSQGGSEPMPWEWAFLHNRSNIIWNFNGYMSIWLSGHLI